MDSKKNILFVLLILLNSYSLSQRSELQFIDFEGEAKVYFSNSPQNIWQIGPPEKPSFTDAKSGQNVIITDTIDSYPSNNNSSFSIIIYKSEFQNASQLWLEFYHYFDMDTLSDFGTVEFSIDGEEWNSYDDFNLNFLETDHQRTFIYENVEQGVDPSALITGYSGTWVRENYYWVWQVAYKGIENEPIFPDSIIMRFTFNSDEVDNDRDGWMIDDINVSTLGYSDTENLIIKTLNVIPNPTASYIHITSDRNIKTLRLFDSRGAMLIERTNIYKPNLDLDIGFLPPDIYILIIEDDYSKKKSAKIIKI